MKSINLGAVTHAFSNQQQQLNIKHTKYLVFMEQSAGSASYSTHLTENKKKLHVSLATHINEK